MTILFIQVETLNNTVVFRGLDGQPLNKGIVNNLTQFQRSQRKGNIDVWWLYDDGGEFLVNNVFSYLST